MNARDEARRMLAMARKDFAALQGMLDTERFDDIVFGFHAQQAAEKALKAWIALLGKEYPKTHDLSLLLGVLESGGADCGFCADAVEYNVYAVQLRYEAFDTPDEPLNRLAAIALTGKLIEHIEVLAGGK